jgi:hypothetical protein
MKVAIHQPNYLPWCGFFAKMRHCDVFVFLDDADVPGGQSYVSRTRVRQGEGEQWLSVPISKQGRPPINQVTLANPSFREKHIKTLYQIYGRAPCYQSLIDIVHPALTGDAVSISQINLLLLRSIATAIGIRCQFVVSSDLSIEAVGDERLIQIVKKLGGDCYLSGPGGENYQSREKFEAEGLALEVRTYRPVPYEAPRFSFVPGLSIVDALAVSGPQKTFDLLAYPDGT